MMLISSRDVQAIRRSGVPDSGLLERTAAGAVSDEDPRFVAFCERGQPLLVEVDDRDVVLVVERFDHGRADLAGTDDDDLHRRTEG